MGQSVTPGYPNVPDHTLKDFPNLSLALQPTSLRASWRQNHEEKCRGPWRCPYMRRKIFKKLRKNTGEKPNARIIM